MRRSRVDNTRTIELVHQGHDDPLNLANSSLGALGGIALKHQRYAEAIAYYSEQDSARESGHVIESLWRVARAIPSDDATLDREVRDPIVQRLLIAFAISRSDHTCTTESGSECGDQIAAYFPHLGPPSVSVVNAIGRLPAKDVQWPDQVAAIAYGLGDFELADRLVKLSDTPYADWFRAKLALHEGKMDAAAAAFASASKGFVVVSANTSGGMPDTVASRMHAEHGVFFLSRGDYVEALYQLSIAKGFEDDARYVAERVLSVHELKTLVDSESWADGYRDLLARRLARVNRIDDAVPYYKETETKAVAVTYATQMHRTGGNHRKAERAAAWYEISMLDVFSGMELRGSERCPDYAEHGGAFGEPCEPTVLGSGEFISDDEVTRVSDSAIEPNRRFHYRTTAVGHLFTAIDLVPRHSDTLSAMLCNGVSWLQQHGRSDNEDLIKALYSKYVKDGRVEPWTQNFGATCPTPSFK